MWTRDFHIIVLHAKQKLEIGLDSTANVVAVSIQYRLIDVYPWPCAYNDSWTARKWVASHLNADGPEDWLNQHANFQQVFISGDSAGSELLHGETQDWSDNLVDLWEQMSPTSSGIDDPWLNRATDSNLARVGFLRLQVFVSENDLFQLRERGWYYAQKLRESGWSGYQEVIDFQGENHVFHLNNLNSRNSTILRNRIVTYINQEWIEASVRMKPSRDW
ncbi:hypothetical protein JRO89_XS02G0063500 [Xanthoceras sorbifolium]|uniref:Alpha/beta hydrolase fold-3 domain-containing protein n=1 Tax=Xanthoceras sorbifolium TaxID=99658 RepID=A0ABQ8IEX2_9ROSI|nr:hypothetical protein JRO89_XS02G0063500 [Xanthoceras sorbifolium]